jgi:hypothetical protein
MSPFSVCRSGVVPGTALIAAVCIAAAAQAQVVGRARFSVKNAADEKPVEKAKITLKDPTGTQPDVVLSTSPAGEVTTLPLAARGWQVTIEAEGFQTDSREVTLTTDAVTEVEVLLEPLKERVIRITGRRQLVNPSQTQSATRLDRPALDRFPLTGGNPQSLPSVLRSVPGLVGNSVNQVHPRGEHSATGVNLNGFFLPGVLQGRAGQVVSPSALQEFDVLTGGFAPEYGGETAAILNLTLRSGTQTPFQRFELQGGAFSTFNGELTFSGQSGKRANGEPGRVGYFMNVSARRTTNFLEPPQPDRQEAHNAGSAQTYVGNFDFQPTRKDSLSLTLSHAPAFSEVANRTGLPGGFAPFGQGFGYGGELSRAEAAAAGILSQDAAGQSIGQRDSNYFGVLSWRRQLSPRAFTAFSLGGVNSGMDINNRNPAVSLAALPADSSIEFNPTIQRSYRQVQPQGSITLTDRKHTYKAGFLFTDQQGDETYRLEPGSQVALNALFATDPRLAPSGTPQVDAAGDPVLDRRGNQVFIADPGARTPTLRVRRSGHYLAGYVQDTWNASRRFTVNYGLRADFYRQSQNLGQRTVDTGAVSPRLNLSYLVDPKTVARVSYNRLFMQPPLAQGAILGQAIPPELLHQVDVSLERQVAPRQVAKIAYYTKSVRNQSDTGLLVEGTQIGAFSSVSLARAHLYGLELSYQLLPQGASGLGGFFNYTLSKARPGGATNTGEPVEPFNDHDQRHTANFGVSYGLRNGASAALSFYVGSGVFSSALAEGAARNARTQLNLVFSSGPRLFGKSGISSTLTIENLTDDRSVINFASPFSGTRFQQGRRVLFMLAGKF